MLFKDKQIFNTFETLFHREKDHPGLKLTAYLAGPMEKEADYGRGWRDNVKELLGETIDLIDPLEKERQDGSTVEQAILNIRNLREGRDWKGLCKVVAPIIKTDMNCVFDANFLIVKWDENIKSDGTISEVFYAWMMGVPVLVFLGNPLQHGQTSGHNVQNISSWLLTLFLDNGIVFDNGFEEMMAYILSNTNGGNNGNESDHRGLV